MALRSSITSLLASAALFGMMACGSSGSSSSSGTMSVHLVDGPISGYQHIYVNIQTLEINGPNGWVTLSTPGKTYDLLALTGGVSATLASGATLPVGHYEQMRLILGSGNTVALSDGTTQPLTVPSGLQTGIKFPLSFDVQAGTMEDVFIDFDAAHSIQVVQAGNSGQYILRPTVRAFNQIATGSVSGKFTDGSGAAIAGAEVFAETLDGANPPTIARTVMTAADGTYTLDLLPVGGTYFVVSQPVAGTTSYNALASGGFAVTPSAPTFVYNATFSPASATGTVSGSYGTAATSSQSDTVDLIQTLTEGSSATTAPFALRSKLATVTSTGETYSFTLVPVGAYTARSTRTTLNPDGSTTVAAPVTGSATVTSGATATVNF